MSFQYRRPDAPSQRRVYSIEAVLADLVAVGVELGDELDDQLALVTALDARRRDLDDATTRRNRIVAALLDNADADVTALLDDESRADVESNSILHAADNARWDLIRLADRHADDLCRAVGNVLAEPAIATMNAAAKIARNVTAMELLRLGRLDEAEALAELPTSEARLRVAIRLRRTIYHGSNIDDLIASFWRDPTKLDRAALDGLDGPERWVEGIRHGADLWFPTFSEAHAASVIVDAAAKLSRRVAVA